MLFANIRTTNHLPKSLLRLIRTECGKLLADVNGLCDEALQATAKKTKPVNTIPLRSRTLQLTNHGS